MRTGPFSYSCTSPGGCTTKAPGAHCDCFSRRPHGASAGEAEIDFGSKRMAVIGADLAGFPASHGEVTLGNFAEDLLDMVLGVPLLLAIEAEDVHGDGAPAK